MLKSQYSSAQRRHFPKEMTFALSIVTRPAHELRENASFHDVGEEGTKSACASSGGMWGCAYQISDHSLMWIQVMTDFVKQKDPIES
jgi:hypothetical protein